MKLWSEIILEWLNCLDVLETRIRDLKELEDGKFYHKLISLFSWKGIKDTSDTKSIVTQFLLDEYPEFKFNSNDFGNMEHMYVASLFLLHVSQEPLFHQPMCVKLQHETQLKIKAFLEMIIPYGKGVNRELLKEIIAELEDSGPGTPMTPKTKALKNFLNSPAARSAQIHKLLNERNLELRKLKTELEVERFEKSDLQEDLKIQQNKVQNLQKKLQEKTAEMKALQEERNRQNTPQSCKKNKNTIDNERYYRREIDRLEDQLLQKQCEVDRVEADNDILTKKLTSTKKQCTYFKEKLENCEKYLETARMMGELKDRELLNLRTTNEELRAYLKEFSKTTMEQSFEIEGIVPLISPSSSLNSSEVLSSVIEIQLQEAKEETTSLKTQLNTLNKKLESSQKKNESLINENKTLQDMCTFQKEQNITETSKLKETIEKNVKEIGKLTATIEQYSEEISYLKQIQVQKEKLEKDLCKYKEEMDKKDLLIKSCEKRIQASKMDLQTFVTEFHTIKKSVSNKLIDSQKQHKETGKNILNACETLYHNYTQEQFRRNKLEQELIDIRKELKDSKNLNIAFENDSIKNKQILNDLEVELTNTKDNLLQSGEKLKKLVEINETLGEQVKNLKSKNEEILMNFNKTNSELKLSRQEVCNILDELKSKDEKLGDLITEITALKSEKEHILRTKLEEESEMKDSIGKLETELLEKQRRLDRLYGEMKEKEEALEHVQNKLEKLTTESIVSEKKMNEVISNLQEVRSNQEAVLGAQEKALQEKCLIVEQLRKEFNEAENALRKRLENEKLLCQNLQSTNSQLQIQSYKQMKTIDEMQEMLKKERNELGKSKEYCQAQDAKKLQIVRACELLRQSTNDLKLVIVAKMPKNENLYADSTCNEPYADNDEVENILNTLKISINEIQVAEKLILYLSDVNTSLNEALKNQKEIVNSCVTKHEAYVKYLNNIIGRKIALKHSLENVMKSREDLDLSLNELKQKWDELLTKSHGIFTMDNSICDELKYIQNKKTHLEDTLFKQYVCHCQNETLLHSILWQNFVWSEDRLKDIYLDPVKHEEILDTSSDAFCDDKVTIETQLHKNMQLQKEISELRNEIDHLSNFVASFAIHFESNKTKFRSETMKLQLQVNQLIEDKCELQRQLDSAHLNDEKLRSETKELQIRMKEFEITSSKEKDDLENELMRLKEENSKLQEERNELIARPKKEDVDNQLKDIYEKYKLKLDEMKHNMRTVYNEQIAKLNKEQEQCVQERLESLQRKMVQQCRKQADELSKYKVHVANISTQIWEIGEKLLSEQQEKARLQEELDKLKAKYQNLDEKVVSSTEHKSTKCERIGENKEEVLHKVAVIQERTMYERRCSIRSIQTMGNAFNAEDEEEVFDNIYLADMKESGSSNIDVDRLSILKQRNALCKPHLKSSYPAEMQFHPVPFSEEEIKSGPVGDEMFNDSLSQSLLPEQKIRKRDRTQISYKKPGPPTPSKNGGRLSLQGNELKSPNSRILKERNKDRATTTPRTLKSLFSSKRQDENTVTTTPRGRRRSSIFRKYRGDR